jgi:hypothetical protein
VDSICVQDREIWKVNSCLDKLLQMIGKRGSAAGPVDEARRELDRLKAESRGRELSEAQQQRQQQHREDELKALQEEIEHMKQQARTAVQEKVARRRRTLDRSGLEMSGDDEDGPQSPPPARQQQPHPQPGAGKNRHPHGAGAGSGKAQALSAARTQQLPHAHALLSPAAGAGAGTGSIRSQLRALREQSPSPSRIPVRLPPRPQTVASLPQAHLDAARSSTAGGGERGAAFASTAKDFRHQLEMSAPLQPRAKVPPLRGSSPTPPELGSGSGPGPGPGPGHAAVTKRVTLKSLRDGGVDEPPAPSAFSATQQLPKKTRAGGRAVRLHKTPAPPAAEDESPERKASRALFESKLVLSVLCHCFDL